jgi:hypothetical protein
MEQLRVLVGEPLLVIDFRYHLVSLIAVFMAIALGIIIGTTALNEPILADIENQVSALEKDKRSLEDRTQQLQTQLATAEEFEQAVAPVLVDGTLAGQSVLLVRASEDVAPEVVEQVTTLVGEAGGTVNGAITLRPAFTDPSAESSLQSYVTGSGRPPGIQLPETNDTGRLVGSLMAQVLMVPPSGAAPADGAAVSSVLAGLTSLDVLSPDSDTVTPANYAVVLTAGAFTGDDAAERNGTLVDLVSALDAAGSGAVVAGDAASAGENGLVGAIRADPALSAAISTVDNVDTVAGQVSTILALGAESEGTSGKYGTGEDTQPVPPVPAAAP